MKTLKQPTPTAIVAAVADHFDINSERLLALKQPKFEDHALGYGRASLIMQAIAIMVTGMTAKELAPRLNRATQSIHKARAKVDEECRTDPRMRADVVSILRTL